MKKFISLSGIELKNHYNRSDIKEEQVDGVPGEFPYTRGIHKDMYRGKLWTVRQFSGFGRAEDTNRRWKYLLSQGQNGLSTAFDMPTLMGLDSDDPFSAGEVGREGVAVDTLADFEKLFEGIPLEQVSVSFTINAPAVIIYSMYLALAEKRGIPIEKLRGTCQTDIFKEYHAQNEWVFPPKHSVKLIVDMFEFSSKYTPLFNPISVSGYHIREAGSNAVQELAFTLADGFAYVEAGKRSGLDIDCFAPRISFFFNCHMDFFEEIAKFRAARRIWAREMSERYGAKNRRSMTLRFHTQTAGCSLSAQQPELNIIRTTIEALAAVLGGTQSLHTNSFDEALCLPSESAARIAVRTQQIIAYETGCANVVDPLGGSYFVEWLTDEMERRTYKYFEEILRMGNNSFLDGVIKGIEEGYFRKEIAKSSFEFQKRVESGDYIVVGVSKYRDEENDNKEFSFSRFQVPDCEAEQIKFLSEVKKSRNELEVKKSLAKIEESVRDGQNTIPPIIEALKQYATEGEIMSTLKKVFGEYYGHKTL